MPASYAPVRPERPNGPIVRSVLSIRLPVPTSSGARSVERSGPAPAGPAWRPPTSPTGGRRGPNPPRRSPRRRTTARRTTGAGRRRARARRSARAGRRRPAPARWTQQLEVGRHERVRTPAARSGARPPGTAASSGPSGGSVGLKKRPLCCARPHPAGDGDGPGRRWRDGRELRPTRRLERDPTPVHQDRAAVGEPQRGDDVVAGVAARLTVADQHLVGRGRTCRWRPRPPPAATRRRSPWSTPGGPRRSASAARRRAR